MRVAVTTTADSGARLAKLLVAADLQPVALPCIRIEPALETTLATLRNAAIGADWIFITSRRAVRLMWPDDVMPPVPVAAVGPATAAAVASAGGRPDLVGEGGAAALARRLAATIDGGTVVYPSARIANTAPVTILSDAGAEVITEAVYATVPIAPDVASVDAAIFGSPSAVDGWLLARPLTDLGIVAAMGATTADALIARGRPADIVPDPPGLEPIVATLAATAAERSPI